MQSHGFIPPAPGFSDAPMPNDPTGILRDIATNIRAMRKALAPGDRFTQLIFNGSNSVVSRPLGDGLGFNAVLVTLKAGSVDLYWSDSLGTVPDITLPSPSDARPYEILLPHIESNQVQAVPTSNALGSIYLMQW